jgi:diacylglycerol kinase family enzyme
VDAIFNGVPQFIDAGVINGKVFFCTAGVGFDAVVGDSFNKSGSRGLITYVEYCAKVYMKYRPEYYEISLDGRTFRKKAFLITFANSSQWGNNVFIAPDANISDGMVDVVVWKAAPKVTMPILTAELFLKTLKYSEYVEIYRCKELSIKREKEGLVQFDGESVMMGSELAMSVMNGAVEVIVPVGWKPVPQIKDLLPQAWRDLLPQQLKDIVPKLKDIVK